MNKITAAKILSNELSNISDASKGAALDIALASLYQDIIDDWFDVRSSISAREYLELNEEEFKVWKAKYHWL
jgi:hypothetical protein